MNTEHTQQVAEVVAPTIKQWSQELLQWAQSSHDFVIQQAPLLAQEIITWGIVGNIIRGIVGISVFIVMLIGAYKIHRHNDWGDSRYINVAFLCALSFFSFLISIDIFMNALQAYFAPRLYLIKYLASLVK